MKPSLTRTVRFTQQDLAEIESFLKNNPFFDFSSLARISIQSFIRKPSFSIRPSKGRVSKTAKASRQQ